MLEEVKILCPYCGARIGLLVDCSVEEQSYYEDCSVCCAPMRVEVRCSPDATLDGLEVRRDDE